MRYLCFGTVLCCIEREKFRGFPAKIQRMNKCSKHSVGMVNAGLIARNVCKFASGGGGVKPVNRSHSEKIKDLAEGGSALGGGLSSSPGANPYKEELGPATDKKCNWSSGVSRECGRRKIQCFSSATK